MSGMSTLGTRRYRADVLVTTVSGRVSEEEIRQWDRDFLAMQGARFWVFDAMACTGYEIPAVDAAASTFKKHYQSKRLEVVVAILQSRMVRMGASLVAMISKVPIVIVASWNEAEAAMGNHRKT
jgi:hypothetical protein